MVSNLNSSQLLHVLHLVSPTLPVGAYSYSEGLESCVDQGIVTTAADLHHWLQFELNSGAIRTEAAIVLRSHRSAAAMDWDRLLAWHHWLGAFRETDEIRSQSLQMGRSLLRLLMDTHSIAPPIAAIFPEGCHFAIAFAIAAQYWNLDAELATLGYLYSWLTNLVNAGVRLVPLGQTAGQQILLDLYPIVSQAVAEIMDCTDADLWSCNWGTSLASMTHETQYSRLFRS
jgi:urease accessory protein